MNKEQKRITNWMEAGLTEESEVTLLTDDRGAIIAEWWSADCIIVHETSFQNFTELLAESRGIEVIDPPSE